MHWVGKEGGVTTQPEPRNWGMGSMSWVVVVGSVGKVRTELQNKMEQGIK